MVHECQAPMIAAEMTSQFHMGPLIIESAVVSAINSDDVRRTNRWTIYEEAKLLSRDFPRALSEWLVENATWSPTNLLPMLEY